jgi:hypothetical protein
VVDIERRIGEKEDQIYRYDVRQDREARSFFKNAGERLRNAAFGRREASTVLKELEKVPVPHCGATTTIGETTPIGDKCPNTISQRKPNNEADYGAISRPGVIVRQR